MRQICRDFEVKMEGNRTNPLLCSVLLRMDGWLIT